MSHIGVSYDFQYTPNPVTVDITPELNGSTAQIKLVNAPRVLITATPHYSSNIGTVILSVIGTPLVDSIATTAGAFATEILQNKSFDVYTLSPFGLTIAGTTVHLKPANLGVTAFNGMLMLTGDLSIQ